MAETCQKRREKEQLPLPFDGKRETARLERVERLMGDKLRGRMRRASELVFDYPAATKTAEKNNE